MAQGGRHGCGCKCGSGGAFGSWGRHANRHRQWGGRRGRGQRRCRRGSRRRRRRRRRPWRRRGGSRWRWCQHARQGGNRHGLIFNRAAFFEPLADLLTGGAKHFCSGEVDVAGQGEKCGEAHDDNYSEEEAAAQVDLSSLCCWSIGPGLRSCGLAHVHEVNARPLLDHDLISAGGIEHPAAVSAPPGITLVLTPSCGDPGVAAIWANSHSCQVHSTTLHAR